MNTFQLIALLSGIIVLSFVFNILAKKTNIPSVLMLILLGIGIRIYMDFEAIREKDLGMDNFLQVLIHIGLVMIVLEASMDLKLQRQNRSLALQALAVAIFTLIANVLVIAFLFSFIFPGTTYLIACLYAIPFSILSSAIIAPSVAGLTGTKKEFMVYNSTFSDLLGIFLFHFLWTTQNQEQGTTLVGLGVNMVLSLVVSFAVSYVLIYIFQHLKTQVKLALIVSTLMLMFALGEMYNLSALFTIFAFGLMLNNANLFFRGRLKKQYDTVAIRPVLRDFKILTMESAFLIRTFFFVLFGLSVTLSSLYNGRVLVNSLVILLVFYGMRFLALRFLAPKQLFPEVWIAPRGLISIVLFFVLLKDEKVHIDAFDSSLLLYPIIFSSVIMMIALIKHKGERVKEVLFYKIPLAKGTTLEPINSEKYNERMEENIENKDFDGF